LSDVREKIINAIKVLPVTATYEDILDLIILQKDVHDSIEDLDRGDYELHEKVMEMVHQRIIG
jgi:hypothetical protein